MTDELSQADIDAMMAQAGINENDAAAAAAAPVAHDVAGTAPAAPQAIEVADFGFDQLAPEKQAATAEQSKLDMIMDVSVQISVEMGRTRMPIKDLLSLSPGSVIELDKLAGDPLDIFVNDSLVAKGKVVVVDENFGIRITDLVSPEDRIKSLK